MRVVEASAPGRCGIIGNPSDIYGGIVVSCSIPARARCRVSIGSADGDEPADPRLWRAALDWARRPPSKPSKRRFSGLGFAAPVAVEWATEVPRSSGLSGSTALLAATMVCLAAGANRPDLLVDPASFAETLRDVERHDAKVMCGYQDAYAICLGGLLTMSFAGKSPVDPGPRAGVERLAVPLPFLLITTGIERLSGAVHGPMSERWMRGEQKVVDGMRRIAELGELGTAAIRSSDWGSLAELMSENHRIIAGLGGSGDEVDRLVQDCLDCGALSAKLAGAGLGGTVIALTHEPDVLQGRLAVRGYGRFMRPEVAPGVMLERT